MSSGFISDSHSEIPEFVIVHLVTLTAGADVHRFCTDAVDFVSRGDTFLACGDAMEVSMYEEREDVPPRGRIRFSNLQRDTIASIRALDPREDITVLVEIVTSDEPNTVQSEWNGAAIREVSYDAITLDCEISAANIVEIGTPALSFDPAHFPAMHARGSS